jgi:hypothetical protein
VHTFDLVTREWDSVTMGAETAAGARVWHTATHITYVCQRVCVLFV